MAYLYKMQKASVRNKELKDQVIANNGSIQNINGIPDDIKKLYRTSWELKQKSLIDLSKKKKPSINEMISNEPYIPELDDLYNLYQYVLINKRTTIFEFGSGWSTLIFSLALKELQDSFLNEVKLLRRNNKFDS